jgi:hypothetical protein
MVQGIFSKRCHFCTLIQDDDTATWKAKATPFVRWSCNVGAGKGCIGKCNGREDGPRVCEGQTLDEALEKWWVHMQKVHGLSIDECWAKWRLYKPYVLGNPDLKAGTYLEGPNGYTEHTGLCWCPPDVRDPDKAYPSYAPVKDIKRVLRASTIMPKEPGMSASKTPARPPIAKSSLAPSRAAVAARQAFTRRNLPGSVGRAVKPKLAVKPSAAPSSAMDTDDVQTSPAGSLSEQQNEIFADFLAVSEQQEVVKSEALEVAPPPPPLDASGLVPPPPPPLDSGPSMPPSEVHACKGEEDADSDKVPHCMFTSFLCACVCVCQNNSSCAFVLHACSIILNNFNN